MRSTTAGDGGAAERGAGGGGSQEDGAGPWSDRVAEGTPRDLGRNRDWSASAASSPVWYRSCGLFAINRSRIWTRPEGRSGRWSVIGTGRPPRRIPRRSIGVLPGNG